MRYSKKAAVVTAAGGALGLLLSVAPTAASAAPAPAATACHNDGGAITADGASRYVSRDEPGRGTCFTFSGSLGDDLTLGIHKTDASNNWSPFASSVTVRDPQGTIVARYSGGSVQAPAIWRLPIPTLTTAGQYSVEVAPIHPAESVFGTFLYLSSRATVASTTIDGPAVPVVLDRPGQQKEIRFTGRANQLVEVTVSDFALTNRFRDHRPGVWIEVLRPSGAVAYRGIAWGNGTHAVGPLRIDGESIVRVYPYEGSLGSATYRVQTLAE